MRCIVFVDMNNFQSALTRAERNARADSNRSDDQDRGPFRIDWVKFGPVATQLCGSTLNGIMPGEMIYHETRIYGTYQAGDAKHLSWSRFMARQPGIKVNMIERQYVECSSEREGGHYIEKGLYSSMIADMLVMGLTKMYDVAILASSDLELLPAVSALARSGIKVICLSASGNTARLAEECWAEVDIFSERARYKFVEFRG